MKKEEQKYINFRNAVLVIGLSLICFAVQMISAAPLAMAPMLLAFVSAPLSTIISGAIFVLLMNKAPYRGTMFLFILMFSIPMLFMGTPYVVLVFLLGAVLGEAVFWKDNTRTPAKLAISYAIFAVALGIGTYLPAAIQKDALLQKVLDQGIGQAVYDAYDKLYSIPFIAMAIGLTVIASFVGIFIGCKIFKKHFAKV